MKERLLKISTHAIGWGVMFTLPFFIIRQETIDVFKLLSQNILSQLFLVAYFYLNSLLFVPLLLSKQRYLLFTAVTCIVVLIFIQLPDSFAPQFIKQMQRPPTLPQHIHTHHHKPIFFIPLVPIIFFMLVFIMSTGLTLLQELLEARTKRQIAENEKSRAELATLKAQINPHFLFNTLNSIYSLALENSANTADAIMKLSGIMRYVLTDTESDFVDLSKEVDYTRRYVDLQKLRLTDKTTVVFEVKGMSDTKKIAPLLFAPFVENAFKFGVSPRIESTIYISIEEKGAEIFFSVGNTIIDRGGNDNTGLGIENVKQRLTHLYPDLHDLRIEEGENTFRVRLSIKTSI